MKEDRLADLGDAVLHHAKRLYLQSLPLIDGDRLGQLAYLIHQSIPSPACCLYYLDSKYRLLDTEVLYSGIILPPEEVCARLTERITEWGASRAAVSVAHAACGMEREDLDRASRVALYCEAESIPLLEIVWVDEESYLPLCRYFGRGNQEKS